MHEQNLSGKILWECSRKFSTKNVPRFWLNRILPACENILGTFKWGNARRICSIWENARVGHMLNEHILYWNILKCSAFSTIGNALFHLQAQLVVFSTSEIKNRNSNALHFEQMLNKSTSKFLNIVYYLGYIKCHRRILRIQNVNNKITWAIDQHFRSSFFFHTGQKYVLRIRRTESKQYTLQSRLRTTKYVIKIRPLYSRV